MTQAKIPTIRKKTIADILTIAQSVLVKAKACPALPAPDTFVTAFDADTSSLASAEESVTQLRKSLTAALAARDAKLASFRTSEAAFVAHVNTVAKGDPALIASTGLAATAAPKPKAKPAAPAAPLITTLRAGTTPGEVMVACQAVKGAKMYLVARSTDQQSFTQVALVTTSKVTLTGQPEGVTLWLRMAAAGPGGQSPWSAASPVVAASDLGVRAPAVTTLGVSSAAR